MMAHHMICYSGKIPANTSELLAAERFEQFMELAKEEFDYVIVDTAPTLLVTDTLLVSQSADCTLFVCRVGVTDKKLLDFSKELYKSKKLRNMSYVLNEVGRGRSIKDNYGHGYGYGGKRN